MVAWGLIGQGLGIVSNVGGQNIQNKYGVEGLETSTRYKQAATNLQNQIVDEQMARMRPYYNVGVNALSQIQGLNNRRYPGGEARFNRDVSNEGQAMYGNAMDMLSKESMRRGGGNYLNTLGRNLRQDIYSNDMDTRYGRLSDLISAGQGLTGQLGTWMPDQSNTMTQIGRDLSEITGAQNTANQNVVTNALDRVSGLPAYLQYGRNQNNQPALQSNGYTYNWGSDKIKEDPWSYFPEYN